jgi:hypothetical protein
MSTRPRHTGTAVLVLSPRRRPQREWLEGGKSISKTSLICTCYLLTSNLGIFPQGTRAASEQCKVRKSSCKCVHRRSQASQNALQGKCRWSCCAPWAQALLSTAKSLGNELSADVAVSLSSTAGSSQSQKCGAIFRPYIPDLTVNHDSCL